MPSAWRSTRNNFILPKPVVMTGFFARLIKFGQFGDRVGDQFDFCVGASGFGAVGRLGVMGASFKILRPLVH